MAVDYEELRKDLNRLRGGGATPPTTTRPGMTAPTVPLGGPEGYKAAKARQRQERGVLTPRPPMTPVTVKQEEEEKKPWYERALGKAAETAFSLPGVDLALDALYVVGTPARAGAAAVREGMDVVLPRVGVDKIIVDGEVKGEFTGMPSLKDWARNTKDANYGYQEILKDLGMEKSKKRSALGFGLDIALDPTSYISGATVAVAGKAAGKAATTGLRRTAQEIGQRTVQQQADDVLRVAINQRRSTGLVKALVNSAETAGYQLDETGKFADPALNKLVTDTSERGLGALTPRGLERAGVSPALRDALGIPEFQKAIGIGGYRTPIPGTKALTFALEDVKGAAKAKLRTSGLANLGRTAFITDKQGKRAMVQRLMNVNADVEERVTAAVALTTVNGSMATARAFGADFGNRIARQSRYNPELTFDLDSNLVNAAGEVVPKLSAAARRGSWFSLSRDDAVAATRALEDPTLPQGPLQAQARQWFDDGYDQLEDFGVEVPYRTFYVPQQTTEKADKFAKKRGAKNKELAKFYTTNIYTPEGFQRRRSLVQGSDFFNEVAGGLPLQTGTIKEINERFRAYFDVDFDLFEEDVRVILPRYIASASQAVMRADQIRRLADTGIGRDIATKMVRKRLDPANPTRKNAEAIIRNAEAEIKKILEDRRVTLSNNTQVRYNSIDDARNEIVAQQTAAVGRRDAMAKRIADLDRKSLAAERELQAAQKAVDAAQISVDTLKRSIPRQRGIMGRELTSKLLNAQKRLDQMQQNLAKKRAQWAKLSPPEAAVARAKYEAEFRAVQDRIFNYTEDLNKLSTAKVKPGFGPTALDVKVRKAEAALQATVEKRNAAMQQFDLSVNAANIAIANDQWAIDLLDRYIKEMDAAIALTSKAGKPKLRRNKLGGVVVTPNVAEQYRLQMSDVATALRRIQGLDDSDGIKRILKLEAAAAASDAKVAAATNQLAVFEQMIAAAENRQFTNVLEEIIEDGMKKVSSTTQLPEWVLEMTQVKDALKKVPLYGRWVRKYGFDLFRGYAIARPGFHVRNAYSGLFGMYMEAGPGSGESLRLWTKYMRMFRKFPDKETRVAAALKAGMNGDEVRLMEEAWEAVQGTGSGLIGKEGLGGAERRARLNALNPLSAENVGFRASRAVGERVEDLIRGAHAYDVLRRGGSIDQAIDVVNFWQFNYLDITRFDEWAKLINPFWVFFSRNVGLQAQTWVQSAARFNRSFMNFKKNFGQEEPEGEDVPEYYRQEMAIRTGEGPEGGIYLFTDLPAATWPSEFEMITSPLDKEQLGKLLSTTGPWIKAPIEFVTGKSLFTGAKLDDTKYERLDYGLRQAINALGWDVPGTAIERNADGELVIRADVAAQIRSALPLSGQLGRLFPGTEEGPNRERFARRAYFTGLGFKENDLASQRGEQYRQYLQQQEEAKRRRNLGVP